MIHEYKSRKLFKTISLFIILSFVCRDIVQAQKGGEISYSNSPASSDVGRSITENGLLKPGISDIEVPFDIGKVLEKRLNDGRKECVINIQDAHTSLSAQHSISDILNTVVSKYDINVIGLEGSEGYLDTSLIRAFPDKSIKKSVADSLMRQSKISAGEFFAITSDRKNIGVYGIEDSLLYIENVKVFRKNIEKSLQDRQEIRDLISFLEKLRGKIFNEELLYLDKALRAMREGEKPFKEYFGHVVLLAGKLDYRIEEKDPLYLFKKALDIEKEIDFKKADLERENIIDILTKEISKPELETLVSRSVDFEMGKIRSSEYHKYLIKMAESYQIEIRKYENLASYLRYITLYESLDIFNMVIESDRLSGKIRNVLFENDDQKRLYSLLDQAYLIKGLFDTRISNEDFRNIKRTLGTFKRERFYDFIRERKRPEEVNIVSGFDADIVDNIFNALPRYMEFYEIAEKRNTAMFTNILKRMRERGENAAVLVSGGFHSEGLKEILGNKGFSYFLIAPEWEKDDTERPYVTILTDKNESYYDMISRSDTLALFSHFSTSKDILSGLNISQPFLVKLEAVAYCLAEAVLKGADLKEFLYPESKYIRTVKSIVSCPEMPEAYRDEIFGLLDMISREGKVFAVDKKRKGIDLYIKTDDKAYKVNAKNDPAADMTVFSPISEVQSEIYDSLYEAHISGRSKAEPLIPAGDEPYGTSADVREILKRYIDEDIFVERIYERLKQKLISGGEISLRDVLSKVKAELRVSGVKEEDIRTELEELRDIILKLYLEEFHVSDEVTSPDIIGETGDGAGERTPLEGSAAEKERYEKITVDEKYVRENRIRKILYAVIILLTGSIFPRIVFPHEILQKGEDFIATVGRWSATDRSQNTLWGISRDYLTERMGTAPDGNDINAYMTKIAEANNISIDSPLKVGQELKLPEIPVPVNEIVQEQSPVPDHEEVHVDTEESGIVTDAVHTPDTESGTLSGHSAVSAEHPLPGEDVLAGKEDLLQGEHIMLPSEAPLPEINDISDIPDMHPLLQPLPEDVVMPVGDIADGSNIIPDFVNEIFSYLEDFLGDAGEYVFGIWGMSGLTVILLFLRFAKPIYIFGRVAIIKIRAIRMERRSVPVASSDKELLSDKVAEGDTAGASGPDIHAEGVNLPVAGTERDDSDSMYRDGGNVLDFTSRKSGDIRRKKVLDDLERWRKKHPSASLDELVGAYFSFMFSGVQTSYSKVLSLKLRKNMEEEGLFEEDIFHMVVQGIDILSEYLSEKIIHDEKDPLTRSITVNVPKGKGKEYSLMAVAAREKLRSEIEDKILEVIGSRDKLEDMFRKIGVSDMEAAHVLTSHFKDIDGREISLSEDLSRGFRVNVENLMIGELIFASNMYKIKRLPDIGAEKETSIFSGADIRKTFSKRVDKGGEKVEIIPSYTYLTDLVSRIKKAVPEAGLDEKETADAFGLIEAVLADIDGLETARTGMEEVILGFYEQLKVFFPELVDKEGIPLGHPIVQRSVRAMAAGIIFTVMGLTLAGCVGLPRVDDSRYSREADRSSEVIPDWKRYDGASINISGRDIRNLASYLKERDPRAIMILEALRQNPRALDDSMVQAMKRALGGGEFLEDYLKILAGIHDPKVFYEGFVGRTEYDSGAPAMGAYLTGDALPGVMSIVANVGQFARKVLTGVDLNDKGYTLRHPDPDIRAAVCDVFGELGKHVRRDSRSFFSKKRIVEALLLTASGDEVPLVRERAARALVNWMAIYDPPFGPKEDVRVKGLFAAALNETNPEVKVPLIEALAAAGESGFRDPHVEAAIVVLFINEMAKAKDPAVIRALANSIVKVGVSPMSAGVLAEAYSLLPDGSRSVQIDARNYIEAREAVLAALGAMGREGVYILAREIKNGLINVKDSRLADVINYSYLPLLRYMISKQGMGAEGDTIYGDILSAVDPRYKGGSNRLTVTGNSPVFATLDALFGERLSMHNSLMNVSSSARSEAERLISRVRANDFSAANDLRKMLWSHSDIGVRLFILMRLSDIDDVQLMFFLPDINDILSGSGSSFPDIVRLAAIRLVAKFTLNNNLIFDPNSEYIKILRGIIDKADVTGELWAYAVIIYVNLGGGADVVSDILKAFKGFSNRHDPWLSSPQAFRNRMIVARVLVEISSNLSFGTLLAEEILNEPDFNAANNQLALLALFAPREHERVIRVLNGRFIGTSPPPVRGARGARSWNEIGRDVEVLHSCRFDPSIPVRINYINRIPSLDWRVMPMAAIVLLNISGDKDENDRVRLAALEVLGRLPLRYLLISGSDKDPAVDVMSRILEDDVAPEVQAGAVSALRELGDPLAIDRIGRIAADGDGRSADYRVRERAQEELKASTDTSYTTVKRVFDVIATTDWKGATNPTQQAHRFKQWETAALTLVRIVRQTGDVRSMLKLFVERVKNELINGNEDVVTSYFFPLLEIFVEQGLIPESDRDHIQQKIMMHDIDNIRLSAVKQLHPESSTERVAVVDHPVRSTALSGVGAIKYYPSATVTGYTAGPESCGKFSDGLTSTGIRALPEKRIVAADPLLFPYGTVLEIEGLGVFQVQDTGSDMRLAWRGGVKKDRNGNVIKVYPGGEVAVDVLTNTVSEAYGVTRRAGVKVLWKPVRRGQSPPIEVASLLASERRAAVAYRGVLPDMIASPSEAYVSPFEYGPGGQSSRLRKSAWSPGNRHSVRRSADFMIPAVWRTGMESGFIRPAVYYPDRDGHPGVRFVKTSSVMPQGALDESDISLAGILTAYKSSIEALQKQNPEIAEKIRSKNRTFRDKAYLIGFLSPSQRPLAKVEKLLAIYRLGELGDATVVSDLERVLVSDPDPDVKFAVLVSLGMIGIGKNRIYSVTTDPLLEAISSIAMDRGNNIVFRMMAIVALSGVDDMYVVDKIAAIIADPTESVQMKRASLRALKVIGKGINSSAFISIIVDVLLSESEMLSLEDPDTRKDDFSNAVLIWEEGVSLLTDISRKSPTGGKLVLEVLRLKVQETRDLTKVNVVLLPLFIHIGAVSEMLGIVRDLNGKRLMTPPAVDPSVAQAYVAFREEVNDSSNTGFFYPDPSEKNSAELFDLIKVFKFDFKGEDERIRAAYGLSHFKANAIAFYALLSVLNEGNASPAVISAVLRALSGFDIQEVMVYGDKDGILGKAVSSILSDRDAHWAVIVNAVFLVAESGDPEMGEYLVKVFDLLKRYDEQFGNPQQAKEDRFIREALYYAFIYLGKDASSYIFNLFQKQLSDDNVDVTVSNICRTLDPLRYGSLTKNVAGSEGLNLDMDDISGKFLISNPQWMDTYDRLEVQGLFNPSREPDKAENGLSQSDFDRIKGVLTDEHAPERFYPLLRDNDWRIRSNAAKILGAGRDPSTLWALIEAAEDPHHEVRKYVAWAIAQFVPSEHHGVRQSIDPRFDALKKLAEDETSSFTRVWAVTALGTSADERAINVISSALSDDDDAVKYAAVKAAERTNDTRLLVPLIDFISRTGNRPGILWPGVIDSGPLWYAAKKALRKMVRSNPSNAEVSSVFISKLEESLKGRKSSDGLFVYLSLAGDLNKEVRPNTFWYYLGFSVIEVIKTIFYVASFVILVLLGMRLLTGKVPGGRNKISKYLNAVKGGWDNKKFYPLDRKSREGDGFSFRSMRADRELSVAVPEREIEHEPRVDNIFDGWDYRINEWESILRHGDVLNRYDVAHTVNIPLYIFNKTLFSFEIMQHELDINAVKCEKTLERLKITMNLVHLQIEILSHNEENRDFIMELEEYLVDMMKMTRYFLYYRRILDSMSDAELYERYRGSLSKLMQYMYSIEYLKKKTEPKLVKDLVKLYDSGNNVSEGAYERINESAASAIVKDYFASLAGNSSPERSSAYYGRSEEMTEFGIGPESIHTIKLGLSMPWGERRDKSRKAPVIFGFLGSFYAFTQNYPVIFANPLSFEGLAAIIMTFVWSLVGLLYSLTISRDAIDLGIAINDEHYKMRKKELNKYKKYFRKNRQWTVDVEEDEFNTFVFERICARKDSEYRKGLESNALDFLFIMVGNGENIDEYRKIIDKQKGLTDSTLVVFIPDERHDADAVLEGSYFAQLKAFSYYHVDESIPEFIHRLSSDADILALNPEFAHMVKGGGISDKYGWASDAGRRYRVGDLKGSVIFAGGKETSSMLTPLNIPIESLGDFPTGLGMALMDAVIGAVHSNGGISMIYPDAIRLGPLYVSNKPNQIDISVHLISPDNRTKEGLPLIIPGDDRDVYRWYEKGQYDVIGNLFKHPRVLKHAGLFDVFKPERSDMRQLMTHIGFTHISSDNDVFFKIQHEAHKYIVEYLSGDVLEDMVKLYGGKVLTATFHTIPILILSQRAKGEDITIYKQRVKNSLKELTRDAVILGKVEDFIDGLFDIYSKVIDSESYNIKIRMNYPPKSAFFVKYPDRNLKTILTSRGVDINNVYYTPSQEDESLEEVVEGPVESFQMLLEESSPFFSGNEIYIEGKRYERASSGVKSIIEDNITGENEKVRMDLKSIGTVEFIFDDRLLGISSDLGFDIKSILTSELEGILAEKDTDRLKALDGKKIHIVLFDRSRSMFEDNIDNGLIGVNAVVFKEVAKMVPYELFKNILLSGVSHELMHEAGVKDEELISRTDIATLLDNMEDPENDTELMIKIFSGQGREDSLFLDYLRRTYEGMKGSVLENSAAHRGNMRMLIGLSSSVEMQSLKKELSERFGKIIEYVDLGPGEDKKNGVEKFNRELVNRGIKYGVIIDTENMPVVSITTGVKSLIRSLYRKMFSDTYLPLLSNAGSEMDKGTSRDGLAEIARTLAGNLLPLSDMDIDRLIAEAGLTGMGGIIYDHSVSDMCELSEAVKGDIDDNIAFVVSDALIQSNPSVAAKIALRRHMHKGSKGIKDVLAILNPAITKENVTDFLENLGISENIFDHIILYEDIAAGSRTEITADNIGKILERSVRKVFGDDHKVILVGGKDHFAGLVDLSKAILAGISDGIDKYISMIEGLFNKYNYVYEDSYIEILDESGKVDAELVEALKKRRNFSQEHHEYKEFMESYRHRMEQFLKRL